MHPLLVPVNQLKGGQAIKKVFEVNETKYKLAYLPLIGGESTSNVRVSE